MACKINAKLNEDFDYSCPKFKGEYLCSYVGKITGVYFRDGILTAMLGSVYIMARMPVLPDFIKEGAYVNVSIKQDGYTIEPFEHNEKNKEWKAAMK